MYVRWKQHNGTPSAYLMKSVRVDGKPKQQTIAYLGSATTPVWFWTSAEEKLATLDLSDQDKAKIYQALEAKCERPTAKDLADFKRQQEQWQAKRRPSIPPLLGTTDSSPDHERPLFIKWDKTFLDGYEAHLARETDGKIEMITKLGDFDRQPKKGMDQFWYNVHLNLCKIGADRDTYKETMRLLGKRFDVPKDFMQIVARLRNEEIATKEEQIAFYEARIGRLRAKLVFLHSVEPVIPL
jgi:hypothetical protein